MIVGSSGIYKMSYFVLLMVINIVQTHICGLDPLFLSRQHYALNHQFYIQRLGCLQNKAVHMCKQLSNVSHYFQSIQIQACCLMYHQHHQPKRHLFNLVVVTLDDTRVKDYLLIQKFQYTFTKFFPFYISNNIPTSLS